MTWLNRRILVCGGRDYPRRDRVWAALDAYQDKLGRGQWWVLVHGACQDRQGRLRGADGHADAWACARGIRVDDYPAKWRELGRAAGPARNKVMAESGLVGAIVFPGGAGTAGMTRLLRQHEVPIWWPEQRLKWLPGERWPLGG